MEDKEIILDFSSFAGKFKENEKYFVYAVLLLILIISAWLRMAPVDASPYLASADPYWQYRHAREIYEHGYPGTTLKEIDGKLVPWDEFHNAPEGSEAGKEFYQYFVAYSYKYFAKAFFPTLMGWMKLTPVLFATLAVLSMFLLVRQLFGEKPGLAAAFIFGLSSPYFVRTYSGHADTDAVVGFFILFTMYLFVKAWDIKSFVYSIAGGISLGFFGLAWPGGYTFIPIILVAATFLYFIYKVMLSLLRKENILHNIKKEWKDYAVILIFLVVGLAIVAIVLGPMHANLFKSFTGFMSLKAQQRSPGSGDVRNVMLTVAEMNPSTTRFIISSVHVSMAILSIVFFFLLPFGLWKQVKEKEYHLVLFVLWFALTFYASISAMRFIQYFSMPLSVFVGLGMASLASKINSKRPMLSILIAVFLFSSLFVIPNIMPSPGNQLGPSFVKTAYLTSKQIGGGPGSNWLDFYNWIKTSTPNGTILASWWDPGHEVTALGERAVVADGSQNYVHIHDLGVILTTTNESKAVELLKKYKVDYFFVSSDLIGKYGAISFLGTGQGTNYFIIPLGDPTQNVKHVENSTLLLFNIDQNSQIIVNAENNGNVSASLARQWYPTQKIARLFYVIGNNATLKTETDVNSIDAMLFIFPDYRSVVFLPPELEKNMLTQLYFFNGVYLKHFELVKDFNGEIKIYKVKYD